MAPTLNHLSQAVGALRQDKAGITHCWEQTQLLCAWERAVQAEAASKVRELFPNMNVDDVAVDLTNTEDPDADDAGAPFTQVEHDEEWVDWVDWGAVDALTAGAAGSSSA